MANISLPWEEGSVAQHECDGREVQILHEPDQGHRDMSTTYASDYMAAPTYAVPASRSPTAKTSINGHAGEAKFYGDSTYKASYRAWPNSQMKPFRPEHTLPDAQPTDYETSYQASFARPNIGPRAQGFRPTPNGISFDEDSKFHGRTTTQDAFRDLGGRPAESCMPKRGMMQSMPFEGGSTSHADFGPPPPHQRSVSMKAPVAAHAPTAFHGTSTYNDAYKTISVPQGPSELGLQVVGGKFYPMLTIKTGAATKSASARVTTTIPNQQKVEVVAIAKAPGKKSMQLGHFVLDGFPPKSVPHQAHVLVTFELLNQNKLRVKATNEKTDRQKVTQIQLRDFE